MIRPSVRPLDAVERWCGTAPRKRSGKVILGPGQGLIEELVLLVGRHHPVFDVPGLAALLVRRDHHLSGDQVCHLDPVIEADEVYVFLRMVMVSEDADEGRGRCRLRRRPR